jgi:hypothetical protein
VAPHDRGPAPFAVELETAFGDFASFGRESRERLLKEADGLENAGQRFYWYVYIHFGCDPFQKNCFRIREDGGRQDTFRVTV